MADNDKISTFLKYLNSGLITLMTLLLIYGVASITDMRKSVDDIKIKQEIEGVQRQNNSGVVLDHEGRIRSLENDLQRRTVDIKEWTSTNFVKK